jgi:hypothetical protein
MLIMRRTLKKLNMIMMKVMVTNQTVKILMKIVLLVQTKILKTKTLKTKILKTKTLKKKTLKKSQCLKASRIPMMKKIMVTMVQRI